MKHLRLGALYSACIVSLMLLSTSLFSQGTINGTITNASGEAIIGVNVFLEGTSQGTTSDIDGKYSLKLPAENNKLVVSFIGFTTQKHDIQVSNGATITKDIVLKSDVLSLDAIVVTGTFGTRSQKESPISLTYLDSRQIENLSASSTSLLA